MTPDELRNQLVTALAACSDPDAACQLLTDARDLLERAPITPAARQGFWQVLYEDIVGLAYAATETTRNMDTIRLVLTVAQEQIDGYRRASHWAPPSHP
jgi:hypothetical protein